MKKITIAYYIHRIGIPERIDIYTEKKLGDIEEHLKEIVREIDPNYENEEITVRIESFKNINGIIY